MAQNILKFKGIETRFEIKILFFMYKMVNLCILNNSPFDYTNVEVKLQTRYRVQNSML